MKKMIAVLTALMAAVCSLTACGSNDSSSSDAESTSSSANENTSSSADEHTSSSVAESTASSSADDEMTTTGQDANTTEKKQSASTEAALPDDVEFGEVDEDLAEAFNDMIDKANNMDFEGYFNYLLPEELIDPLLGSMQIQKEEMIKDYEESSKDNLPLELVELVGIKEDDSMLDDAIAEICEGYAEAKEEPELQKYFKDIDLADYLNVSNIWSIRATVKTKDGEESDEEFVAYYLEGEGWKFDNFLFSQYRSEESSKQQSLDSIASSLQKAATSALTDLDVKDVNISGKYIISSDSSKDRKLPAGFKRDDFTDALTKYFDNSSECDWFIVGEDGSCTYAVIRMAGEHSEFGVYPSGMAYTSAGPGGNIELDYTYEELYYDCCKAIGE